MTRIRAKSDFGTWPWRAWKALFTANSISAFGDEFTRVALPAKLYAQGGQLPQLAWLNILQTLPLLLGAPVAGWAADRGWTPQLLVAADLLRAAGLVAMVFAPDWQTVLVFAAVLQFGTAVFSPAETVLESLLLETDSIVAANSRRVAVMSVIRIAGPISAGLVLGLSHVNPALSIDAATFIVSAALIAAFVRAPSLHAAGAAEIPERVSLRSLWSFGGLRVLFLVQLLMYAVFGLQGPLFFDFAARELAQHASAYGWIMGALSMGSLLGAWAIERVLERFGIDRIGLLGVLVLLDSAALTLFTFSRHLLMAELAMAGMGVLSAGYQILVRSAIQQLPAEGIRGRAAGLFAAAGTPAMVISLFAASPLRNWSGSTPGALRWAALLEVLAAAVLLIGSRANARPASDSASLGLH